MPTVKGSCKLIRYNIIVQDICMYDWQSLQWYSAVLREEIQLKNASGRGPVAMMWRLRLRCSNFLVTAESRIDSQIKTKPISSEYTEVKTWIITDIYTQYCWWNRRLWRALSLVGISMFRSRYICLLMYDFFIRLQSAALHWTNRIYLFRPKSEARVSNFYDYHNSFYYKTPSRYLLD